MKATIIIPVYNAAKRLPATIESILKQDDSDFEVLLVDDCSSDDSLLICKEIEARDCRFHCIEMQYNSGPSATRNVGISHSRGKYLLFIDSDDTVSRDFVSVMTATAENQQADIVWCDFQYVFDPTGLKKPSGFHLQGLIPTRNYLKCFLENTVGIGSLWNKCFRKDFIQKNNILLDENRVYGEDWDFNLQTALKCPKVYAVTDILYNYIHYDSHTVSTRYYATDFDNYCKSFDKLNCIAEEYNLSNNQELRSNAFVYNIISLLYKLAHSNLTQEKKQVEYTRIVENRLFRNLLSKSISNNNVLTKRQKLTAYLLQYRLKFLAWRILKI